MTSTPSHIPLWLLKQLSAESAFYESVHETSTPDPSAPPELKRIERIFLSAVGLYASEGSAITPNQHLDQFASQIMRAFSTAVDQAGSTLNGTAADVVSGLRGRLERVDCSVCAAKSTNHVCDGNGGQDSATISEGGDATCGC